MWPEETFMYNNYNFKNYASFHRYSKHISRKITTDYTKQKIAESSNMMIFIKIDQKNNYLKKGF